MSCAPFLSWRKETSMSLDLEVEKIGGKKKRSALAEMRLFETSVPFVCGGQSGSLRLTSKRIATE